VESPQRTTASGSAAITLLQGTTKTGSRIMYPRRKRRIMRIVRLRRKREIEGERERERKGWIKKLKDVSF